MGFTLGGNIAKFFSPAANKSDWRSGDPAKIVGGDPAIFFQKLVGDPAIFFQKKRAGSPDRRKKKHWSEVAATLFFE